MKQIAFPRCSPMFGAMLSVALASGSAHAANFEGVQIISSVDPIPIDGRLFGSSFNVGPVVGNGTGSYVFSLNDGGFQGVFSFDVASGSLNTIVSTDRLITNRPAVVEVAPGNLIDGQSAIVQVRYSDGLAEVFDANLSDGALTSRVSRILDNGLLFVGMGAAGYADGRLTGAVTTFNPLNFSLSESIVQVDANGQLFTVASLGGAAPGGGTYVDLVLPERHINTNGELAVYKAPVLVNGVVEHRVFFVEAGQQVARPIGLDEPTVFFADDRLAGMEESFNAFAVDTSRRRVLDPVEIYLTNGSSTSVYDTSGPNVPFNFSNAVMNSAGQVAAVCETNTSATSICFGDANGPKPSKTTDYPLVQFGVDIAIAPDIELVASSGIDANGVRVIGIASPDEFLEMIRVGGDFRGSTILEAQVAFGVNPGGGITVDNFGRFTARLELDANGDGQVDETTLTLITPTLSYQVGNLSLASSWTLGVIDPNGPNTKVLRGSVDIENQTATLGGTLRIGDEGDSDPTIVSVVGSDLVFGRVQTGFRPGSANQFKILDSNVTAADTTNEGLLSIEQSRYSTDVLNNTGIAEVDNSQLSVGGLLLNEGELSIRRSEVASNRMENSGQLSLSDTFLVIFGDRDVVLANDGVLSLVDSTVITNGTVLNNGSLIVDPSTLNIGGDFIHGGSAVLASGPGDVFNIAGDFRNTSTMAAAWDTSESLIRFVDGPGQDSLHVFELGGSIDMVADAAGLLNNFAWGTLALSSGQMLSLADPTNDGRTGALYVGSFLIDDLLVLATLAADAIAQFVFGNGFNIYYDPAAAGNSYLGGATFSLANGGSLIALADVTVVQEPSELLLLAMGLLALLAMRRLPPIHRLGGVGQRRMRRV